MSNEKEIRISITQEDKVDIGTQKETKILLGVEQDNINIKMSKEENVEVEFETKEIITTRNHSKLDNLDFENSGHIGFASAKDIEKVVPKRLSVLPIVNENAERDKVYLYADENGTSKRISMRNMLDTKIRTVNGIPNNLQVNEYIFNEIE